MRTSTRTPRISWFKCTPVDFLTDPDFLSMSAAARGAYFSLMLYGWNAYTQGSGLSADPASLQRITGMLPLEWDSVREQVLAHFKVREDGTLCLPWQWDEAQNATEKVRQLREAAAAATKSKIAEGKKIDEIDEIDEIRLDKNGRPNGQVLDEVGRPNGQPSPNERPNGHPSASTPASTETLNGSVESAGYRSRPTRQASGHIAAPTPDTPSPSLLTSTAAQENLTPTSTPTQDSVTENVQRIRDLIVKHGGRVPCDSDIASVLSEYPDVAEVEAAVEEYIETAEPDPKYLEFQLCQNGGGGLKAVIRARRERQQKETQDQHEFDERKRQHAEAKAQVAADAEAWKMAMTAALPTWTSEKDFDDWKIAHPMPLSLRDTPYAIQANQTLNVNSKNFERRKCQRKLRLRQRSDDDCSGASVSVHSEFSETARRPCVIRANAVGALAQK